MKKLLLFFTVVLMAMSLTACGGGDKVDIPKAQGDGAPDWARNLDVSSFEQENPDYVYGVGVVTNYKTSLSDAITDAYLNAITNISREAQLDVAATLSSGTVRGATGSGYVEAEKYIEESVQTVSKARLRNAKRVQVWKKVKENSSQAGVTIYEEVYVLVRVPKKDVLDYQLNVAKKAKNIAAQNPEAKGVLERLQKQIETELIEAQ